jgi:mono/diheme cytochrome c family protein/cytochrome c553
VSFRDSLIVLNIVALAVIVGVIVWRVFSIRRNPEDKQPDNLERFLPDEDLEGRRLERALGWSLLFVMVIAVALPVYFLVEPNRQAEANDAFLERSIERGEILFANNQSLVYDSTKSLLCANCHGLDAKGGVAPYVLQPESDLCLVEQNKNNAAVPECLPKSVSWSAPDLTLAALRYDRAQLTQILTYGRPGTPMPAWGIKSGKGVLNEQGIDDLVNYLESVKTTSVEAKKAAGDAVDAYKQGATDLIEDKDGNGKTKDLADAQAALAKGQAEGASASQLNALQIGVDTAQAELNQAIEFNNEVQQLSDGAILFRLNCARCHTKGWSYHVTEPARTDLPPLPPQGSGAYGPNLRDGSTLIQFPGEAGVQQQFDWVALGVPANNLYGQRGISSGRMPHFGKVLTEDQIKAIVAYERSL